MLYRLPKENASETGVTIPVSRLAVNARERPEVDVPRFAPHVVFAVSFARDDVIVCLSYRQVMEENVS
jgi:hypothetical protein